MHEQKRPSGGVFLFQAGFWAWCGWALIATSWLNASHYRPWVNFQSEFMALAGVGLVFVAWAVSQTGRTLEVPLLAQATLLVLLVPLVHAVTGLAPFVGDLWISLLYLAGLAAAITVGHALSARPAWPGAVLPGVPFGAFLWFPALVSALIGVLQWLDYSEVMGTLANHGDLGQRPMGNVAQTNQLATLLLMGGCAAWHDFESRKLGHTTLVLMLALLTAVLALTQSRTGLLSAAVVAIYLFWRLRSRRETAYRTPWAAPLIWLGLLGGFNALVPWINDTLLLGGNREISFTDPNSRQILWEQMLYAIGQSPWWGYGWNQTPTAHNVGALAYPGELTYSYAHNLVIDWLAWCGIPLGLLLSLALAYWFMTRMKRVQGPAGVAAMAALLPFAVHSLLEYPFAYTYFLVSAGVLAGMVEARLLQPHMPGRLSRRLALAGSLTLGVLGLGITYEYIQAEEEFRVVRFSNMRIGAIPEGHSSPNIHVLTQLGAMLRAGWIEAKPGMDSEDIRLLHHVARRFPYGALGYRYALAMALNGDPDGAAQQMRVMRGMYGERYYQGLAYDLTGPQTARYPQLKAVRLP